MTKRKMCPGSQLTSQKKPNTGSSAERSAMAELVISRGTPRFEDGVLSMLFGINSAVGAISRAQEVLLDKIELIAAKVETLSKEVQSMKAAPLEPQAETSLPVPSWMPSDAELAEWLSSPIPSPERICSPDIACSETPYQSFPPSIDLTFQSGGYTELLEAGSPEWPMMNSLKRM